MKETKATTQPAKVEDMSQPVQSTKIEAVVNKPEASIHKVEEASKPEEKPETKKVDDVQVAQKEFERRFRKRKMRLLMIRGLTKKYNIQKYVLQMKGSMRIL